MQSAKLKRCAVCGIYPSQAPNMQRNTLFMRGILVIKTQTCLYYTDTIYFLQFEHLL